MKTLQQWREFARAVKAQLGHRLSDQELQTAEKYFTAGYTVEYAVGIIKSEGPEKDPSQTTYGAW